MPTLEGTPVVFVHGLWLHATSWQPWIELFRSRGYDPVAPLYPGEGPTVEATRRNPEALANVGFGALVEHYAAICRALPEKPIVIGHSVGGLVAEQLLGMGVARAAVALAPVQMKGILSLPIVQLRSLFPLLRNPLNFARAVPLTKEQFHAVFASAVSKEESDALHTRWHIDSPARPLFETALANVWPNAPTKVDRTNTLRGPLLLIGGHQDRTVPASLVRAAWEKYRGSRTVNDCVTLPAPGHSLTVDRNWREVADLSLGWLERQGLAPVVPLVQPEAGAASTGVESGAWPLAGSEIGTQPPGM